MKAAPYTLKRSRCARRNLVMAAAVVVLSIAAFAATNVARAADTPSWGASAADGDSGSQSVRDSQIAVPDETAGQTAVLYEEDLTTPRGARYEGTVSWRVDSVPASIHESSGIAIVADVDIPERNLRMRLSIRPNTDASLPASHVAEIAFTLPADFSGGQLLSVKGILTKAAEQARGTPLAETIVRVRDNFFMIGMSKVENERLRNMMLLKNDAWLDIPIVYQNQHRAILAVEKSQRAFDEAFAAWGP